MKGFAKYIVFVFLISVSPIYVFSQCMLAPVSLDERVSRADLIVEGVVVGQHCFWENGKIYTDNTIEVYQVLKGTTDSSRVHVFTEGGRVDNIMEVIPSLLALGVGETGIFTCKEETGKKYYTAYASAQGFIKYDETNTAATDIFNTYASVKNQLIPSIALLSGATPLFIKALPEKARSNDRVNGAIAISGFSPDSISAGTRSLLTITGSGFGASQGSGYVTFYNTDDGGRTTVQPLASQYISWSDTEIKVYMPATLPTTKNSAGQLVSHTAGGGKVGVCLGGGSGVVESAKPLVVKFAQLNVIDNALNANQAQLVDYSGNGGYVFYFSADFDQVFGGAPKAAFLRAFNKWRCASDMNWIMGKTPAAVDQDAFDHTNIVKFDDATKQLPAGVLGLCKTYFSSCGSGRWFVSEMDIVFDREQQWSYNNIFTTKPQYDFESVLLHELGHGQQLAHSNDSSSLMYYGLRNNRVKNNIDKGSLLGTRTILQSSTLGGQCGYGALVTLSGTECSDSSLKAPRQSVEITATPNPFTKTTYITCLLNNKEQVKMELFDIYGKYMGTLMDATIEKGAYEYTLDFSAYPANAGVYILKTIIGSDVYITKLFKI